MENKNVVTLEELTLSNTWELEALINVLIQKGIIKKEEVLKELQELKKEHDKKINLYA